jgi:hypothetical protein
MGDTQHAALPESKREPEKREIIAPVLEIFQMRGTLPVTVKHDP